MSQAPWKFPTTESVQEQKDLAGFKDWVNTDVDADTSTTPLTQHLPDITDVVNHAVNVINGTAGTDDDRDFIAAEASYVGLRADIAEEITTAIKLGKILLQEKAVEVPGTEKKQYTYGMVSMDQWRTSLPLSRQQHYNCQYCANVWPFIASVVVLNDDGTLDYPVANVLLKNSDSPIVQNIFNSYPEVRKAIENRGSRNVSLLPLATLHSFFEERHPGEVGKWDHFYGCDKATFAQYNKEHTPFPDFKYVETLYGLFTSPMINVDLLQKIFAYMKHESDGDDHTALSRADELVALIRNVRHLRFNSRHSVAYLWGTLQRNSNRWMKHIQGSLLGIVLDTVVAAHGNDDLQTMLVKCKRLLKKAAAPENYKQKTAEASEASVEQSYQFLVKNGLERTLERRLLPLDEVESIVWKETHPDDSASDVEDDTTTQTPLSALELARRKLKDEKDPAVSANQKMDDILGQLVTKVSMSLKQFITNLNQYKSLALPNQQAMFPAVLVTTATAKGDHEKLLNFDRGVNDYALVLMPIQKFPLQSIARMAGRSGESVATGKELNIDAIFWRQYHGHSEVNYIMQFDGLAAGLYNEVLKEHGTCIPGTAFKSEHFGMSRALTELAVKMEMADVNQNAAGGAFLLVGMTLQGVLKDGSKQLITISSEE